MTGRSGKAAALWGLALVLAATLFPFDFAFDARVSIRDEFAPGGTMKPRGNDLIIGADAAYGQGFKGKLGELRICRAALTPDQVQKAHACAASYSFAQSSGAVLKDDSGNGNDGKLAGGPQWVREQGRAALSFDGSGQYAQVPNSPSIDIGGRSLSISLRVVLEDSPSDGVIVSKPWSPGVMAAPYHQYAVEFGQLERTVNLYFADTRGRQRGPFSVQPPMGVWTHVVFVYDGAVRGYVDGREVRVTGESHDLAELLGNLLLFVPLGFGLAALARSRRTPAAIAIPLVLAIGAALSLGVEVLQCWLPDRDPSLVDIAANSASAALGAALQFASSSPRWLPWPARAPRPPAPRS